MLVDRRQKDNWFEVAADNPCTSFSTNLVPLAASVRRRCLVNRGHQLQVGHGHAAGAATCTQ